MKAKLTPNQDQIIQCILKMIETNICFQKMAQDNFKTTLGMGGFLAREDAVKAMKHNEEMAKINIELIKKLLQHEVGTDPVEIQEFLALISIKMRQVK